MGALLDGRVEVMLVGVDEGMIDAVSSEDRVTVKANDASLLPVGGREVPMNGEEGDGWSVGQSMMPVSSSSLDRGGMRESSTGVGPKIPSITGGMDESFAMNDATVGTLVRGERSLG